MIVTLDIDAIIKAARPAQEHAGDYSFPFFEGLDTIYPELAGYIYDKLTDEQEYEAAQNA